MATIFNSAETTVTINSQQSTTHVWNLDGANYFKVQVDLQGHACGHKISLDSIDILYSY